MIDVKGTSSVLFAFAASAMLCRTSDAAYPLFGTTAGAQSELSVGRTLNWFSITERGDSVANLSMSAPVQFGPTGSSAFVVPAGSSASSVGLLTDGTRVGRLARTITGSSPDGRLAFWPAGASQPVTAETLGESSTGAASSSPLSHNALGDVVGYATRYVDGFAVGASRPVKWTRDGTITELGVLPTDGSHPETRAERISASGHIVGFGRATVDSDFRPIRWLPNSTAALELESFAPLTSTQNRAGNTNAVNEAGTAVGLSRFFSNTSTTFGINRAVRWENGGTAMTALSGLSTTGSSEAFGLNSAGDTVGSSITDTNTSRAVLWPAGQTSPILLDGFAGVPSNASGDDAFAINSSRSIVGTVSVYNGATYAGRRAALWANGSTSLLDLNSLIAPGSGWTLEEAGAITETGFVRGTGKFDPDGAGGVAAYSRSWTLLVPSAGTYGRGDANFDARTDFNDLVLLAQHYGQSNASQSVNVADFDLNGVVDFNDLVTLAWHYNSGVLSLDGFAPDFAADWVLAQSLVPEPAAVAVLLASTSLFARRRR